jgi:hypothetical protein
MSASISIAKEKISERIVHVDEVNKSDSKVYICCDCKQELVVVKSEARKKDWHFRHPTNSDINKCRSTALHDFAVQILLENKEVVLKQNLTIDYSDTKKEVWINDNYRSDVTAKFENQDLHFEVFVTHDLTQEKIEVYRTNKIRCVRIDLSDKKFLSFSKEDLIQEILNKTATKKIIFWDEKDSQKSNDNNIIEWIVGGIVAFLLLRWIFRKLK